MDKDRIRAANRDRRLGRRREDGPALREQLLDLFRAHRIGEGLTLAGYLPVRGEPDVVPAMAEAAARGARVVVPRTAPERRLEWITWTPDAELKPDRHGLFAVSGASVAAALTDAPVVLLIPALAVDQDGTRLGQGAGYYDRVLANLSRWPTGPLRVAVVHPEEVADESLPRQSHDQPIDAILTAGRWWRLPL